MSDHYLLHVSTQFQATRALRHYEGPCANVHSHRFKVQADVMTPPPDERGMVIDFYEIKACLEKMVALWEGCFLNDISPFDTLNPTNENLAKYCFEVLNASLTHPVARVQSVSVWETSEAGVTYRKNA
jgi:6-pyruvoyltetrahydropterin/6-carboxytetrahydropterin synthase